MGNVYVADTYNFRIRKISVDGQVSTIAGNGEPGFTNGDGAVARFCFPTGITIDSAGNLYVTDKLMIQKISPLGMVSTFAGSEISGVADGIGIGAGFSHLAGITIDRQDNIYVTDGTKIRKITPLPYVTTLPDYLNNPQGIAADNDGNLYIADTYNCVIKKIDFSIGHVLTTIAGSMSAYGFENGDGSAHSAKFALPSGILVLRTGSDVQIYVSDTSNNRIRLITMI
jgi:sugar lactone lactonase YvrE